MSELIIHFYNNLYILSNTDIVNSKMSKVENEVEKYPEYFPKRLSIA